MVRPRKIIVVAGARPNFMKVAPIVEGLRASPSAFQTCLVHTGQHYDKALSKVFFDELGIPRPDRNLEVGSSSHAQQTADIMRRFEPVVEEVEPDAVVVVGDVNSTIACALVAAKLCVQVVHVEAGLRSFDRTMPEEVNRVLTDAISDLLLVSEPSGVENLRNEGVPEKKIHLVGNVMIDTLLRHRREAERSTVLEKLAVKRGEYAVLTLHRPSNVDKTQTLLQILDALDRVGREIPILFPVHPRTLQRASAAGLRDALENTSGLRALPALGYLDFLKLQAEARLVITDSGGIQEETAVLRVPCVTIRKNTERPMTITHGTNVLTGTEPEEILSACLRAIRGEWRIPKTIPELWDGRTAERILPLFESELNLL